MLCIIKVLNKSVIRIIIPDSYEKNLPTVRPMLILLHVSRSTRTSPKAPCIQDTYAFLFKRSV